MKCTNRMNMSLNDSSRTRRRLKNKRRRLIQLILQFVLLFGVIIAGGVYLFLNQVAPTPVLEYEKLHYPTPQVETSLFSTDLCVGLNDVSYDKFQIEQEVYGSALFNLQDNTVLMAHNMHEKLYPASTTKLMTFYLGLKYGDLDEVVTISETAVQLPSGSSRAWLKAGDQMKFKDLLYSMMLQSGNDSAKAVGEIISGSEEEFAKLMNEEAKLLGATNSHFVNAHGFHDDNHYTTVYDLYLITNACLKYEACKEIISTSYHTASVTESNGLPRKAEWWQTNNYMNGHVKIPEGVTVVGGKTGTTDEARSCLVLLTMDKNEVPYLSIILGAPSRASLYNNMTSLIQSTAI